MELRIYPFLSVVCMAFSAFCGEGAHDKALYSSDIRQEADQGLPPLHDVQPLWRSNYAESLAIAKESNKPLLLAFLGSSWCPWSIKLQKEVLTDPAFCARVAEDFVLVSLSVERDLLDEKNAAHVQREKFAIQQCPALIIVSPNEEEICKVSYLPLAAGRFAEHLKEIAGDFLAIKETLVASSNEVAEQELIELYTKAQKQGFKKFEELLLEKGLKEFKGTFFMLEKYAAMIGARKQKRNEIRLLRDRIIKSDPENKNGTLLRVAILDFHSMALRLKPRNNPASALFPLEEYVKKYGKTDQENLWKVQMMMAQFLFSKKLTSSALEHAKLSYETAPEDVKGEISQLITYLESVEAKQ